MTEKHVLGLSGGRDSAALAVYMRDNFPDLDIDYFFTDTGQELPEVYDFLGKLEGFLGKPIFYLNPDRDFRFWLKEYGYFLPSARTRWCTRQLKLRPFEKWVRPFCDSGVKVFSYVAIRADEPDRSGYLGKYDNFEVKLPFREHGIDKKGVMDLLNSADLGLPEYYRWRSRSGCTFCFFQQKIEWVRLREEHPEAFEEAKDLEKTALNHDSPFTWTEEESLDKLEKEERISQIKDDYAKRLERNKKKNKKKKCRNAIQHNNVNVVDIDEIYGVSEVSGSCVICHK